MDVWDFHHDRGHTTDVCIHLSDGIEFWIIEASYSILFLIKGNLMAVEIEMIGLQVHREKIKQNTSKSQEGSLM